MSAGIAGGGPAVGLGAGGAPRPPARVTVASAIGWPVEASTTWPAMNALARAPCAHSPGAAIAITLTPTTKDVRRIRPSSILAVRPRNGAARHRRRDERLPDVGQCEFHGRNRHETLTSDHNLLTTSIVKER
jgi:hypothetical protein